MAGNRDGGIKAARTNKEQQGEDWYVRIGTLGGSKKTSNTKNKGLASMSKERRAEISRLGGRKSKRRAKKI